MGQLTIYLPDEVEKAVRRDAKRAKTTVSAYVASLARTRREARDKNGYPLWFKHLAGSCPGLKAAMPKFDDPPEIPKFATSVPDRQRRVRRVSRR